MLGAIMPAGLDAWLELIKEEALDPGLPICDPHHHLWDKPGDRYMIDEIASDVRSGHNVVQTLFVEVDSMYRAAGSEEMKPVGEAEWVRGIGAQSDSGLYGPTKVAAGIVGYANLNLGAAVEPVLEAWSRPAADASAAYGTPAVGTPTSRCGPTAPAGRE